MRYKLYLPEKNKKNILFYFILKNIFKCYLLILKFSKLWANIGQEQVMVLSVTAEIPET